MSHEKLGSYVYIISELKAVTNIVRGRLTTTLPPRPLHHLPCVYACCSDWGNSIFITGYIRHFPMNSCYNKFVKLCMLFIHIKQKDLSVNVLEIMYFETPPSLFWTIIQNTIMSTCRMKALFPLPTSAENHFLQSMRFLSL